MKVDRVLANHSEVEEALGMKEFSFTRLIVEETGISFKGVPIKPVPLSSHLWTVHWIGRSKEKERCSGSYCQAVGFLVIKDDSISERPG